MVTNAPGFEIGSRNITILYVQIYRMFRFQGIDRLMLSKLACTIYVSLDDRHPNDHSYHQEWSGVKN